MLGVIKNSWIKSSFVILTKFCSPEAGAQRHLLSDAGRQERSGSTLRFVIGKEFLFISPLPLLILNRSIKFFVDKWINSI